MNFLPKEIENIINSFNQNDEIIKCKKCNYKDIDNNYNFENICYNCDFKICLICLKNGMYLSEVIINFYDIEELGIGDRDDWLCCKCGCCCDFCSKYYIIDQMNVDGNVCIFCSDESDSESD